MSDFAATRTDLTGIPATLGTATTTKSSGVATFTILGVDVQVQVARDLTIAAGDVCVVQRVGFQWYALQRVYTAAPAAQDSPAPPPPRPPVVTGTLVCSPVETRSYRGSAWRTDIDDIIQGNFNSTGNHTGCAFYGSKPASLTGATVTAATITVSRPRRGGNPASQATTLWLVTETTRPLGAPTLGSSASGPSLRWGESDTFTITTAWAQSMVDGTAGGLAIKDASGSPYVVLSGRGEYSPSFTLSINWQR